MAGREPPELQRELLAAGYPEDTPCVVAHRVPWPGETVVACALAELADRLGEGEGGPQTLVLVGSGSVDCAQRHEGNVTCEQGAGRGRGRSGARSPAEGAQPSRPREDPRQD